LLAVVRVVAFGRDIGNLLGVLYFILSVPQEKSGYYQERNDCLCIQTAKAASFSSRPFLALATSISRGGAWS
jgi:hypothetical protein